MIPFARILNYGNKAETLIEARKICATQSSWFVVDKNSNLHVRGLNTFYSLGIPALSSDSFINDYTVVQTNVRSVWTAQNRQGTVIQKNDGTIYYTGSRAILNGASQQNTFITQFTQQLGLPSTNIKNVIFATYTLALVYENGDVWMSGDKRNVTGVVGEGGWAKHMSNIVQLQDCSTNWMALETSGALYGSGQNISNILNPTASSSTFYAYPVLIGTVGGTGTKIFGEQYSVKAGKLPGIVYGKGYGGAYGFGDGVTTGYTTLTNISTKWIDNTIAIGINTPANVVLQRSFYYTASKIYVFGSGGYGIGGLPDTGWITTPKELPALPFSASTIKFIYRTGNTGTLISTGANWFYSGFYATGANTNESFAEFTNINNLFFNGFDLSKIEEAIMY